MFVPSVRSASQLPRPLRLVSVSRVLPSPSDPAHGIFVLNRLVAMSRLTDLTIVQPVPYFPFVKPLPDWGNLREDGLARVPMFYIPGVLKSLDGVWLSRAVASTISEFHRSKPFDAIDAHFGYPDGAGCVDVGARLDLPVFMTLRGVENEQLQTRRIGDQLRRALDASAGCICVSHSLAETAIRHGVDERKVTVIHNSVERGLFHAGAPTRSRRDLDLPADRPIVVSIGHLIPRKRHHLLIEAFANSKIRKQGAYLAILGSATPDPKYASGLRTMIREKGLEDSVRLIGNRPPSEIGDYLRVADAFALLSAREGCCNAVLESLACGVPVLACDVGDNKYFVNESNGRIVPVDHVKEATDGLDDMLTNSRWDRASVATTLPVGDWNNVAERVIEFMSSVVSPSSRAATHDVPM
jgi:teichuronic acid biosynthesis glycosyltransferase TuaC